LLDALGHTAAMLDVGALSTGSIRRNDLAASVIVPLMFSVC
jgi:hypothetical protein